MICFVLSCNFIDGFHISVIFCFRIYNSILSWNFIYHITGRLEFTNIISRTSSIRVSDILGNLLKNIPIINNIIRQYLIYKAYVRLKFLSIQIEKGNLIFSLTTNS